MGSRKDEVPEIVLVAQSIEQELEQLEGLSRSVQKARLDTDENIARAGRTLQAAVQQQEQIAVSLRRLGEAMLRMQERQQAAIQVIAARAQDVQQQANRLAEHMERFAALGVKAAEATRLLQKLPAPRGTDAGADADANGSDADPTDPTPTLAGIDALLLALSDEARALAVSAEAAELTSVSKDADALRQRVDSARDRLTQLAHQTQQQTN